MNGEAFYSLGCGDRFGRQGEAQLQAYILAAQHGIKAAPVWNKSNREHTTVNTTPAAVRKEADSAVKNLGWQDRYFVDADHISIANVAPFIEASDFFTLDVAANIGAEPDPKALQAFLEAMTPLYGEINLPGSSGTLQADEKVVRQIARQYLSAAQEAGRIYRNIAGNKKGQFAVEVSMDETDNPQTPIEIFFILAMLARENIPVDTIAPKFSGRFNKGVDYVGDVCQFEREFEQDVAALKLAAERFGLKPDLRLSVHSGSDKFAIYPAINRIIKKYGAGLHVKTAGTTWLEEMIGLAEAGGNGLEIAKKIYAGAYKRYDELAAPYATVIDIRQDQLPSPNEVLSWSSQAYTQALRHDLSCPSYNPSFRQLIHVAYKVAHELGADYFNALEEHREIIARNVTYNLWERHLKPIFG